MSEATRMRVTCPVCSTMHELAALVADADARRFVALLSSLPAGLHQPALRYLQLFRAPQRALSWSRGLKVLGELAPMIADGVVRRDGIAVGATPETWAAGMLECADRTWARLPLSSNGYLLEVVMTSAQRSQVTEAEALLRARESQRRTGTTGGEGVEVGGLLTRTVQRSGGSPVVTETSPDKARANLLWARNVLSHGVDDPHERAAILSVAAKAVAALDPTDAAVVNWRGWLAERQEVPA